MLNYQHEQVVEIAAVRDTLAQSSMLSSLLNLGEGSWKLTFWRYIYMFPETF
jgi:hypothetical protein